MSMLFEDYMEKARMESLYSGKLHGFPNLTSGGHVRPVPEEGVMSLVVVLATSVSLVALVFAFITYSLFSDLRHMMGTSVMTLLATTFMGQLIYVMGVGGVHDKELCLAVSFSLQYLHLAAVLWLASLCLDTQRPQRDANTAIRGMCWRFFWNCLLCWGTPALAVAVAYGATDDHHLPYMYKVNCWFSEAKVYLLTTSFPALGILVGAACALVRSRLALVYRLRLETDPKFRNRLGLSGRVELALYGRLVALLMVLEICAALHSATHAYFFWAAYNIIHALQGVLIALSATCNSKVLSVYSRRRRRRSGGGRLLSQTSSLDSLDWRPLPDTV